MSQKTHLNKRFGRKSAIWGKTVKMITHRIIQITKGIMPLKIVSMGTSLATLLTAKTMMPIGGVICPISIKMTDITPNQIGSKFKANTVGNNAGRVSNMIGMTLSTHPRMI
jgi:hypothetical protein